MRVTITVQHQDSEDVFSSEVEEVMTYSGATLISMGTQALIQRVADRAKQAYQPPTESQQ
ncbi:hypothetical protein ACX800_09960 [Paenarthrobacter nitroguajacolicus]|uniref:hypothetical protein n=1 Tax=Paenarthrobacter nitroguajacolicus TaxID=211146 RepID=UPI003D1D37ED